MDIQFVAADAALGEKSALAIVVFEGEAAAAQGGAFAKALAGSRFTGAKGQTLDLLAPAGTEAARVVLVGAGKADGFDGLGAENAAASAYNAVKTSGLTTLRVQVAGDAGQAARAAFGVRLASYRFDKYRTKEAAEKKPSVTKAEIVTGDVDGAIGAFADLHRDRRNRHGPR